MKKLSVYNSHDDIFNTVRKITLWNYAFGLAFRSDKKDQIRTVTFIIERKYSVGGTNHLKRNGYALQHTVCGKNNRISVHKRTQILIGT